MKKILPILFIMLLLQVACKKEKSDFVTGYTPTLLEAANKSYTGNYFPFQVGFYWNWSGTETDKGSMSVKGAGYNQSGPLDDTYDVYGYMDVVDSEALTLPSNTYYVLKTNETTDDSLGNTYLNRYFQISDTAVVIRAILMEGMSEPMEVKNPVFLRRPLIVGDKWQTQPSADLAELTSDLGESGISNMNLTTNCMLFVLGGENVGSQPTVAVQERAEVSGTININDQEGTTGSITLNFTMDLKLDLGENIGIVRQTGTMQGTMSGSITSEGTTMTISLNVTANQTLMLSTDEYYVTSNIGMQKAPQLKSESVPTHSPISKLNNKQLKAAYKVLDRIKKMYML
jgi:hypothetical protein